MIKKLRYVSAFAMTTSLFTSSVFAQSLPFPSRAVEGDMRASISLTIPLGGQRNAATSKPQLDLSVQRHRPMQDQYNDIPDSIDFRSDDYHRQPQQLRIGFTLDDDPQLMMNGRPYGPPSNQTNADTLEKVGLGAAVIGGIVAAAFGALIIATALSDPAE